MMTMTMTGTETMIVVIMPVMLRMIICSVWI